MIRYYALLCNLDASVFVDIFFFQIHPKVLVDPPASCDRLLPSFPQTIAWMEAFHHPPKSREGTLFGSNFVFCCFFSNLSFFFSFHFSREGGGQNFGQFFRPNDPGVEFLVILVSFVTLLRCFGSFLNSGRGDGGCFNGKTLIRKREPNKEPKLCQVPFSLEDFFLIQK